MLIRVLSDNRDLHTPRGTHRRRLAGRRGSADRPGARDDAGDLRARCGELEPDGSPGARHGQGRRADGPHPCRRQTRRPLAADANRGDALARALHADRARARARHLGGLGAALRRVDGARRVSRRPGRRPVGVQRPRRVRGVADARRVRRAVLRLGRHAARSRLRDERAGAHPRRRWRSCSSASRWWRWCSCSLWGYPAGVALRDRGRPGANRRVLVHRRGRRHATRSGHRRCRGTRSSRPRSCRLPSTRSSTARSRRSNGGCRSDGSWPDARRGGRSPTAADRDPRHRAVVIGYGPVGRTVARLLRQNDVTPTIVDLNLDTVRALREEGLPAIYGDAGHRDTLVSAGVPTAGAIILSVAGLAAAREVITMARELNPSILILARTAYIRELVTLKQAGRRTSCTQAKARSRWRSPRRSWPGWAPPPSRSIASAPGCTTSSSRRRPETRPLAWRSCPA